jgi:hypothetical protein
MLAWFVSSGSSWAAGSFIIHLVFVALADGMPENGYVFYGPFIEFNSSLGLL